MNDMANKEYIEKLERILEEEKSKENEDVQLADFEKNIKNQQKEMKLLEKEINLLNNNNVKCNSLIHKNTIK